MYSKDEKLSLLAEMISFARADKKMREEEYNFIVAVASQLGISENEVNQLSEKRVEKKTLQPESQRILQFHRLVLLMNVDQDVSQHELKKLKDFGLRMGLRSEAINTVLNEMLNYPNKVIPPKQLLEIFKRFYN